MTSTKNWNRRQKKEKLLFLLTVLILHLTKVTCKLQNGSAMTLGGKDYHIIRESVPVRPLFQIEKSPHMNQIGLHQERGTPNGKVSIMMKPGTEETGDHHMIDMKGGQDHLFPEMKRILGLEGLAETEGPPFQAMNVTGGFLSHLTNEIEGLLGLMIQDPHSQGMNVIDPPSQEMTDIPGMIGMDGQGMKMISSYL